MSDLYLCNLENHPITAFDDCDQYLVTLFSRGFGYASRPMYLTLIFISVACYVAAALLLWRRPGNASPAERGLSLVAMLLHAGLLWKQVLNGGAVTIGVNEAVSLFTLQSAVLLWLLSWREPLRALGVMLYPLAAFAAIWATAFPTPLNPEPIADWRVRWHILLSMLSAGLLTLAAVQSCALALQDRLLHRNERTRMMRGMPPLLTMERLLFQLIAIGFLTLSLTLLSGLWFIHDWFAQHLAHKTILSITAWALFGVLLWGRWRYGWRGRTAIRWALAGYLVLILAYFGSKLVLEQLLSSHWR